MKRLYTSIACRCASTSTASPCRHAPLRARSITSSSSPKATTNQSHGINTSSEEAKEALTYTAPLLGRHFPTKTPVSSFGWDRKSWIKRSQTTATDPRLPMSQLPPPAPFPSLDAPPPPPLLDSATEAIKEDAKNLVLLQRYLSLGSPQNRALLALPRVAIRILNAAKKNHLPFVSNQILQDLAEINDVGVLPWAIRQAGLEVGIDEAPPPVKAENTKPGTMAMGKAQGVEGSPVEKDGEAGGKNQLRWVVVGSTLRELIERGVATPGEIDFPQALLAETPNLSDTERLRILWDSFVKEQQGQDDADMTLRFLTFLATPATTATSATPTLVEPSVENLRLALQILRGLPSSVLPSIESPPPSTATVRATDAPLSSAISAQFAILRTIVSMAIDHNRVDLAGPPLLSLGELRRACRGTIERSLGDDFEDLAVVDIVRRITENSHRLRQDSYRPPVELASSLELARTLLTSVLPPLLDTYRHTRYDLPTKTLDDFASEATLNKRWDLLRDVYARWTVSGSKARWCTPPHLRLAFLRWLAGESSYRHYATISSAKDEDGHTERPTHPDLFLSLASDTADIYRSHTESLEMRQARAAVSAWTREEKSQWIELLCSSRVANASTAGLARIFVSQWQIEGPLDSPAPFILSTRALLAIVHASNSRSHLPFARSVVNHHAASLVDPHSPFIRPNSSIDYQDLTGLAQAYVLLGDFASYEQVYRKMLAQQMLPDGKDFKVTVASSAAFDVAMAERVIQDSNELKLPISTDAWRGMIRAISQKPEYRTRTQETEEALRRDLGKVVAMARKAGVRTNIVRNIDAFARSFHFNDNIKEAPSHELLVVRKHLRSLARRGKSWDLINTYRRRTDGGLCDVECLNVVLGHICNQVAVSGGTARTRQALEDFIDHAINATPSLLRSDTTLQLMMESCQVLRDGEAAEEILNHAWSQGLLSEEEAADRVAAVWREEQFVDTRRSE